MINPVPRFRECEVLPERYSQTQSQSARDSSGSQLWEVCLEEGPTMMGLGGLR